MADEPDLIQEEQEKLDVQQNVAPSPSYVTLEQVQALLEQQTRLYGGQISGLASKIDKGLNRIRQDTQNFAEQAFDAALAAKRRELLEGIVDPEEKTRVQAVLQAEDAARKKREPAPEPESRPRGDETPEREASAAQVGWQQVFQMVRDYGVDPQNPSIDYAAFTEEGLTEGQRRQRFFKSLKTVDATSSGKPTAPAAREKPAVPAQSPPVEGAPASAGRGVRTVDDVRDLYIQGKLSTEEYAKRMDALGQSI